MKARIRWARSVAASGLLLPVLAVAPYAGAQTTAAAEQALIQMERDWVQAWIKKDTAALGRILADDWVGIDFTGKTVTKAEALRELKSGSSGASSVELGPMTVRVFGQAAVVTGSSVEKGTWQGKDSSGSYVWTDVFANRDGRWQAVSSQSTKTK